MPVYVETFPVAAGDYASAGEVSAKIKSTLKMIGLDPSLLRRVTIAAYEGELNMIIHSLGGAMSLEISPEKVRVRCEDIGPGIEDIELAMQEGYSTAPTSIRMMGFGAGMGLPNMKRNSDIFEMTSDKNGTKIDLVFDISQGGKMSEYFHSVRLDRDKCMGCTNCIKRCPTEAIRVRNGKAQITAERCIDCGVCIRVCPYHAKTAYTDPFSDTGRFRYKIALPAPSLYGQFKNLTGIGGVVTGLKQMGFDGVYEVARGADIVSCAIREKIDGKKAFPVISSACPAIVRLIQVRFPNLIDNILDLQAPMEVAAAAAKREFAEAYDIDIKDVGAFFITPCPAKMTSIKNPYGSSKSNVDGAVSVIDIYGLLAGQLKNYPEEAAKENTASAYGVGWANSGGECAASLIENSLAVDGIDNVIKVLEEIENFKLGDLQFFEGLACPGGCVGGPLTFENPFVARTRIRKLSAKLKDTELPFEYARRYIQDGTVDFKQPVLPRQVMKIDDNMVKAMKKLEKIEEITKRLPGLDCGSCGSPSCRAMAEDIVRGDAKEMDCIFKLRDKVTMLAEQMVELTNKDRQAE